MIAQKPNRLFEDHRRAHKTIGERQIKLDGDFAVAMAFTDNERYFSVMVASFKVRKTWVKLCPSNGTALSILGFLREEMSTESLKLMGFFPEV